MKRLIATLTLGVTLSGGTCAATFQSVALQGSSITFSYKQMGVAMEGRFKRFNAQVSVDTNKPTQAKGSIEIDLASIDTGSTEADQEVVGKPWFNVAAHPKANFVLQSLRPTGPNEFVASGQLTLKGQTHELRAPVRLTPQGMLAGSFVLKRAEYGIGVGIWSKFDVVANEITVIFNLNLK